MTDIELEDKLNELRALPAETEVVEFKEAKQGYDFSKLGKYFSALSNEANLMGKEEAWLVLGVENKKKDIIGSQFRSTSRPYLDSLKGEIANKTTNGITFIEIHELNLSEGRIVMFQIPAAPPGIPVSFEGHYYGRNGEELSSLNLEEIERIRRQSANNDWSEIDDWDTSTFLIKTKLIINGKLTRAAILLLGNPEAVALLSPVYPQISWVLYNREKIERDYKHFEPPYVLAMDELFAKIRNLKYRYLKDGTLFPDEIDQYDPQNIKEALSNCIAHMDYTIGGRISVSENEDGYISFTNPGSFLPGTIKKVIQSEEPPSFYRNTLLVKTMESFNMIDSIGSGIKRMFRVQRERFFPMPDYDFSDKKVKLTLTGKVLDMDYARLLVRNPELSLDEIILLDRVQKRKTLSEAELKSLRIKGLIEGKKPNIIISASIAQTIGQKAHYTINKAFTKEQYFDWIIQGIKNHGSLSRADIEGILMAKLSDLYNNTQKKTKITNLLSELRVKGKIKNIGTDLNSKWVLVD